MLEYLEFPKWRRRRKEEVVLCFERGIFLHAHPAVLRRGVLHQSWLVQPRIRGGNEEVHPSQRGRPEALRYITAGKWTRRRNVSDVRNPAANKVMAAGSGTRVYWMTRVGAAALASPAGPAPSSLVPKWKYLLPLSESALLPPHQSMPVLFAGVL